MAISSLRIANFRNLSTVELSPGHLGLNILYGDNGSGKTSLLEAIYYLGMGKSFRSSTANRLIQQETDKFTLFGQLIGDADRRIPLGVERDIRGVVRMRMDEEEISSITKVASFLPIQVINTHSHNLFESGPVFRRKFLDWGLFYQEVRFLDCWRSFERSLKQRNALLRERRPLKELSPWTEEVVKHGLMLTHFRRTYVQNLIPHIEEAVQSLLGIPHLAVNYYPGWSESEEYAAVLMDALPDESRLGHTLYGPHRADLVIEIDGIPAKHFLSRGQQKLLVCAMIIAQGTMLNDAVNKGVIYLIDDLPAELDLQSRNSLITLLSRQKSQVFITAIERETINRAALSADRSTKMFHVEHGRVAEVATES